jgi:hypothetical protein
VCVCHLAKLVCGQHRSTHYERVQWFTARNGCCEMPLATAPLAMTRCGRIVACGDRLGTRQYQLGEYLRAVNKAMPELSL